MLKLFPAQKRHGSGFAARLRRRVTPLSLRNFAVQALALQAVGIMLTSAVGCSTAVRAKAGVRDEAASRSTTGLRFDTQRQALRPAGYRSWVHAVTSWAAIGKTPISKTPTPTPEFHNVYVEPKAYRTYMETGRWPEGTVLVKEFVRTSVDPKHCGGPPAYICNDWFGPNVMDHGPTGIAVMFKDTQRYPDEPGGWAYFDYGHEQPPYKPASAPHARADCAQCHMDHAGPNQDYVFSVNRPGLSRTGDEIKENLQAAFPDQ